MSKKIVIPNSAAAGKKHTGPDTPAGAKLSELRIENFKGIHQLSLQGLTRISLLGGKNNTGKSSVLDALFLCHDRTNPSSFLRLLNIRRVQQTDINPEDTWAPFFYKFDLNTEIFIELKTAKGSERYSLSHPSQGGLPTIITPQGDPNSKWTRKIVGSTRDSQVKDALKFSHSINELQMQSGYVLMTYRVISQLGQSIAQPESSISYTISRPDKIITIHYITASTHGDPQQDAIKYTRLDVQGQAEELVDLLRPIEPRLKSLSVGNINGITMIHGDIGIGRKIPLPLMGDGIGRLLTIILGMSASKDGLVLIDEIENGLHHSAMSLVWEGINRASKMYNCQVLATTHSQECLRAALEGLRENPDDFSYNRLDAGPDRTIGQLYSYHLLQASIENNWEVRG